ncbi:hypothetical protein SLA2020_439380 [Shorea laevis]
MRRVGLPMLIVTSVVQNAWIGLDEGMTVGQTVRNKLQRCQQALSRWSSSKFRASAKKIETKTKQLECLQRDEDRTSRNRIIQLQKEIDQLLEVEI